MLSNSNIHFTILRFLFTNDIFKKYCILARARNIIFSIHLQYDRLADMKKTAMLILISTTALILPSCAYMQTNKNIEEKGVLYEGTELKKDNISLHRSQGKWYIGTPNGQYSKRYPVIHDSIFFKDNNDPVYTLQQTSGNSVYYPISDGTATCLQRSDGYAQTGALVTEINKLGSEAVYELKHASTRAIRAEVVQDKQPATIISRRISPPVSGGTKALSAISLCTVDVFGTIGYNIAIPFMAPFVFFSEFLEEE